MITLHPRHLTGTGSTTRAFLTEREAVALMRQDGASEQRVAEVMASEDNAYSASTGAKVRRVPAWQMSSGKHRPSTRARSWQVYGYHWAGTDVTDLLTLDDGTGCPNGHGCGAAHSRRQDCP